MVEKRCKCASNLTKAEVNQIVFGRKKLTGELLRQLCRADKDVRARAKKVGVSLRPIRECR